MLRQISEIKNLQLGADDGEIGRVKDFYFDDENWTIRYLVADTGKWLPGRLVLVSPASLGPVDTTHNVLKVNLKRRQIEGAPSVDRDKPVSRQHEVDYARYYGWPMYWYGPALWGPAPYPVYERTAGPATSDPMAQPEQSGDPHLRSANEVIGYHLQAQDDELGHAEDLIIDDQDWAVRYLVVDTRNWLPGKRVLMAPQWIREISWERSRVVVGLTTDAIRNAPEFEDVNAITREYEERLYRHYRHEGYWARKREMVTQ
jgi:hypothetical protein